ncbi:MAG: glycosyltransferase family 39 protein [Anaerolineales bacterium]|nr:glycosyltransferase family 39 protein [Anaerolineales bacterium]
MTTNQQTNKPTNQQTSSPFAADDLLWRQLKTIPAFRAILRAVESRFYYAVDLPGPTLDVGCGDGHFAQMTFDRRIDVGIDPWWGPLNKAYRSDQYDQVLQGMGDRLPFPDHTFASAFSNSVLEHIPDVQAVLNDTSRVLQMNGRFLITMPSQYFTEWLGGAQFFDKLNLSGLADRYRNGFNFISRHVHTDSPEVWAARLAAAGLAVERWQYYFSPQALHALELGHAQGLPAAAMHFLTGHWIVAPWESSLGMTERWLRPFYNEEAQERGAYVLFVARKVADGPIEAHLPPARPFTIAELETAVQRRQPLPQPSDWSAGVPPAVVAREKPALPEEQEEENPRPFDILAAGLLLLAVALAFIGQSTAAGATTSPPGGLRWFVYSFVALLLFVWRVGSGRREGGGKRPSLNLRALTISRRRWWYLAGLLLVVFANRQAAGGNPPWPPLLTLSLWLVGVAVGFYALYSPSARPPEASEGRGPPLAANRRFLLIGSLVLFFTALLIRAAGLTSHPFILNGLEAGIGLDVSAVANGLARNPFATGWLTNPTLPYFLMAVPVKLLGPSVLSIRFLSPLIGALTVVALFWIGTRLWSLEVGLVAAVLLAGSHFHLHYSRLGLTNIWDGLFLLLALGLLGVAWTEGKNGRPTRLAWLLTGLLIGLNAYVYTASHLLPLILLALLLVALLIDRAALRQQAGHIVAAALLALLVALPQILFYAANPGVFMDRFQSYGILSGQTGWLAQEAISTGRSQLALFGEQMQRALLAFNAAGDVSPAYRPGVPLLSTIPAILLALGVMVALLHWRQARYALLLAALGITLLFGGALLLETPSSHRLVLLAPLLSLLAALGLVALGRWALALRPGGNDDDGRPDWLIPALLIVAMLLSLNEMFFYYGRYRLAYTFGDRNTEVAQGIADYLNTLDGANATAYFYGPPGMYVSFPTIPFLATGFHENQNLFDVPPADAAGEFTLPQPASGSLAFIFLPERIDELGAVEEMAGNGRFFSFPGHHADPLFYVYEVELGER